MSNEHLHNAAKTLASILNRRDPEHVYTVDVGPRKGNETAGGSGAPTGASQVGPIAPDSDSVLDGDLLAGPNGADPHRSKQAA